jgi:hypothetical protein
MKGCLISSHGKHNGDSKNERCEVLVLKEKLSSNPSYLRRLTTLHIVFRVTNSNIVLLNTNCILLVLCHQHLM